MDIALHPRSIWGRNVLIGGVTRGRTYMSGVAAHDRGRGGRARNVRGKGLASRGRAHGRGQARGGTSSRWRSSHY